MVRQRGWPAAQQSSHGHEPQERAQVPAGAAEGPAARGRLRGGGGGGGMDNFTKALIAGAFIMGMGTGVWFNSEASVHPSNVACTEIIDRQTPNSEVCMANGYSSHGVRPAHLRLLQPVRPPSTVARRCCSTAEPVAQPAPALQHGTACARCATLCQPCALVPAACVWQAPEYCCMAFLNAAAVLDESSALVSARRARCVHEACLHQGCILCILRPCPVPMPFLLGVSASCSVMPFS